MRGVQELLGRYAHIHPPHGAVKKELIRIIGQRTGCQVDGHNIDVADQAIRITASAMVKQKIFLYKKDIMADLHDALGKTAVRDIR